MRSFHKRCYSTGTRGLCLLVAGHLGRPNQTESVEHPHRVLKKWPRRQAGAKSRNLIPARIYLMEMSLLFFERNKRGKKIYAIHFSAGYWSPLLLLLFMLLVHQTYIYKAAQQRQRYLHLPRNQRQRDPDSTFFLPLPQLQPHRLRLHTSSLSASNSPTAHRMEHSSTIHWARVPSNFVPPPPPPPRHKR